MNIFTFIKVMIAIISCGIFILKTPKTFKQSDENNITKTTSLKKVTFIFVSKIHIFSH